MLTVGDLAHRATILPRHADRMCALLGKAAAVADHHAIRFTDISGDQCFPALPEGRVGPPAFAEKLLHGADGISVTTFGLQDHWLHGLALQIR
jgi:hypothetical protein